MFQDIFGPLLLRRASRGDLLDVAARRARDYQVLPEHLKRGQGREREREWERGRS